MDNNYIFLHCYFNTKTQSCQCALSPNVKTFVLFCEKITGFFVKNELKSLFGERRLHYLLVSRHTMSRSISCVARERGLPAVSKTSIAPSEKVRR